MRIAENPAGLPELPDGVREHMRDCLPHWLFYKNIPGGREWWCSRCGGHGKLGKTARTETPEVRLVRDARHREAVRCPACGRYAEAISLGRIRAPERYYRGLGFLVFYAPAPDDVWIVRYLCRYNPAEWGGHRWQMNPYARPEEHANEAWHMQPGSAAGWWRRDGGEWIAHDDLRLRYRWEMPMPGWEYSDSLGAEIILHDDPCDTFLRYAGWAEYASRREHSAPMYYPIFMGNAAKYPIIEKLCKVGFRSAVEELVEMRRANSSRIDWRAGDVFSALGVNRAELKMLREHGGGMDFYRAYRRARDEGEKNPEAAALMAERYAPGYGAREMDAQLRAAGVRRMELYRYLDAQNLPGKWAAGRMQVWRDYIHAAKGCGYDITQRAVLMPRELQKAHDDAVALNLRLHPRPVWNRETEVTDELREGFAQRAPVLARRFARTGAEYFIRIPQTPEEVIAEGQALQHCVGGYSYINNHADGRNAILFLRRVAAPDEPYYTMEIHAESGKILQCEGGKTADENGLHGHVYRQDLPEAAREFLAEWEKSTAKPENKKNEENAS